MLVFGYPCADGRIPAAGGSAGKPGAQRCVNTNGTLIVEVTKTFGESTVSKILDLVENASSKKAIRISIIRPRLYPGGRGCCASSGRCAAAVSGDFPGRGLDGVGLPRPDLPGYLLSLCARDFGSSGILRRYRRGVAAGRIGEREAIIWRPLPKQRSWCLTRPAR